MRFDFGSKIGDEDLPLVVALKAEMRRWSCKPKIE
jgi:hypothetical protein